MLEGQIKQKCIENKRLLVLEGQLKHKIIIVMHNIY